MYTDELLAIARPAELREQAIRSRLVKQARALRRGVPLTARKTRRSILPAGWQSSPSLLAGAPRRGGPAR